MSGHVHAAAPASWQQRRRLTLVLALTVAILLAEIAGGLAAHSLVLLADTGHVTADAAGIGLSLLAVSWARRPATAARTFGWQRVEILAAVVNALVLLAIGAGILLEGLRRLADPAVTRPGLTAAFGALALAGNAVSLWVLRTGSAQSLNVRGAYLEVWSDLLGAAAVLVAAAVVATTGWQRADPAASLLIGALILPRTVALLRQGVDVLLEAAPPGVDLDDVRQHICSTAGVISCHDLHAWTITSGHAVLSAHVVVEDTVWADGAAPAVLDRLGECLAGHFDLEHSTFQLERTTHADHEPVLHR